MAQYLDPKIDEVTKETPQELLENELTKEALGYVERSAYTKEQLDAYLDWKINIITEISIYDDFFEKGITEGFEKGIEKGEAIGIEKGIEKGEAKKTEQIVINGYRAGIPIETIAVITNLTTEQVIEILKQHK